MPDTARRTAPDLWNAVKAEATKGDKGGALGQWSARKAQMATTGYQRRGGGYLGPKSPDNHLAEWMREDWGKPSGERYLPPAARDPLSGADYARSTAARRRDGAALRSKGGTGPHGT
jgi:hypothetical protein